MSWSGFRTAGTGCATPPVGVAGGGKFGLGDLEKCGQGLGFDVDIGANDAVVDAGLTLTKRQRLWRGQTPQARFMLGDAVLHPAILPRCRAGRGVVDYSVCDRRMVQTAAGCRLHPDEPDDAYAGVELLMTCVFVDRFVCCGIGFPRFTRERA